MFSIRPAFLNHILPCSVWSLAAPRLRSATAAKAYAGAILYCLKLCRWQFIKQYLHMSLLRWD